MKPHSLIACHECDLLQRVPPLAQGVARCPRCGTMLYRKDPRSLERTLALSLAGLLLYIMANAFPVLGFEFEGQLTETTLFSGVRDLYRDGMWALAGLVFLTTIAIPFVELGVLLAMLLPLRLARHPPYLALAFRLRQFFAPWSMMEVFMLGILVAVVKLSAMADIIPGVALWSFAALILVLAAANASFDPEAIWERVEQLR